MKKSFTTRNVVIDTNVIVSAAISPYGNAAIILNMVFDGEVLAFYSSSILAEYIDVLSRPRLSIATSIQDRVVKGFKHFGILVCPATSKIPMPDESDRIFYDAAIESASVLITGNARHYPAESNIMTPAAFLSVLM